MSSQFRGLFILSVFFFTLNGCTDEKPDEQLKKNPVVTRSDEKSFQWGPKSTVEGSGFNLQPSGDSSIWFDLGSVNAESKYEVWFGDNQLTRVSWTPGKVGSAVVPNNLLEKAGAFPVYIISKPSEVKYMLGIFEVQPR